VILVLKHGIRLSTQDVVVLSVGLPFSVLWMFFGRVVVSAQSFYLLCSFTSVLFHNFGCMCGTVFSEVAVIFKS